MKSSAAAWKAKLFRHRHTGTHGTEIYMHRALRRITLSPSALLAIGLLPILFNLLLWTHVEFITGLWAQIFDFWIGKLQLDGQVSYTGMAFLGKQIEIPYPDLLTSLPSPSAILFNILISVSLFALTYFIPKNYLPATYVVRAALLIQLSASLYFILNPQHPPYELSGYISGMLAVGLYMILLVTPLLAMIYYIFNFPLWRKLIVTMLILGFFVIALPFQYMLYALIISSASMLFMPVLYLLFGALLNTLMFVSWYAWAMTWMGKNPVEYQFS